MKKILFAVLLAITSIANAQWVYISNSPDQSVYYKPSSVTDIEGGIKLVSIRSVMKEPQATSDGTNYWSVIGIVGLDCARWQGIMVRTQYYNNKDASGGPEAVNDTPSRVFNIKPKTHMEYIAKKACVVN